MAAILTQPLCVNITQTNQNMIKVLTYWKKTAKCIVSNPIFPWITAVGLGLSLRVFGNRTIMRFSSLISVQRFHYCNLHLDKCEGSKLQTREMCSTQNHWLLLSFENNICCVLGCWLEIVMCLRMFQIEDSK